MDELGTTLLLLTKFSLFAYQAATRRLLYSHYSEGYSASLLPSSQLRKGTLAFADVSYFPDCFTGGISLPSAQLRTLAITIPNNSATEYPPEAFIVTERARAAPSLNHFSCSIFFSASQSFHSCNALTRHSCWALITDIIRSYSTSIFLLYAYSSSRTTRGHLPRQNSVFS